MGLVKFGNIWQNNSINLTHFDSNLPILTINTGIYPRLHWQFTPFSRGYLVAHGYIVHNVIVLPVVPGLVSEKLIAWKNIEVAYISQLSPECCLFFYVPGPVAYKLVAYKKSVFIYLLDAELFWGGEGALRFFL